MGQIFGGGGGGGSAGVRPKYSSCRRKTKLFARDFKTKVKIAKKMKTKGKKFGN